MRKKTGLLEKLQYLLSISIFFRLTKNKKKIECKVCFTILKSRFESQINEHLASTHHKNLVKVRVRQEFKQEIIRTRKAISLAILNVFISGNIPLKKLDNRLLKEQLAEVDINLPCSQTARNILEKQQNTLHNKIKFRELQGSH